MGGGMDCPGRPGGFPPAAGRDAPRSAELFGGEGEE